MVSYTYLLYMITDCRSVIYNFLVSKEANTPKPQK